MQTCRIVTRQSALALWQAKSIQHALQQHYPDVAIAIHGVTTQGDAILDRTLQKVGGKGLFVKELEMALLDGSADVAVHSLKDVPMELPEGLGLVAICQRASPFDAWLQPQGLRLAELPKGAIVGTASLRRQAQLLALRPDIRCVPLRGNIQTRLAKLQRGDYHAIVLAEAGLRRLGLAHYISEVLSAEQMLPAVGQGALALECVASQADRVALFEVLNHPPTALCALAERAFARELGGSCQVPIAGYATLHNDELRLRCLVAEPDGSRVLQTCQNGKASDAEAIGVAAAEALIDQGAQAILGKLAALAANDESL